MSPEKIDKTLGKSSDWLGRSVSVAHEPSEPASKLTMHDVKTGQPGAKADGKNSEHAGWTGFSGGVPGCMSCVEPANRANQARPTNPGNSVKQTDEENNSYLHCGCRWKWRVIIAVKFTAMIILHFHLQPQYKYELFHINFTWFV